MVVEEVRKRKGVLYVGYLDLEKAFDNVNREDLFEIMRDINVNNSVVKVFESMYADNELKLCLGNVETEWMKNNKGVKQGCPGSTVLFDYFIDELLKRVKGTGIGVRIQDLILSVLGFADDTMLLAETAEDMQRLLNVAERYANERGMKFNASKCKIMIFGDACDYGWTIGNNVLEVVSEYKYLGMTICNKSDIFEKHKREKELGMLRMIGMLNVVAAKCGNKYKIIRELWKGVGVPRSLYGYEVCKATKNELDRMERIQNKVARLALGANSFVATEALRGEMGWSTYEERVSKAKINYKVKLSTVSGLNERNWAGYVFRVCDKSVWHKEVKRIERKYNMQNVYESQNVKSCVKKKIREKGQQVWENGMNRKSTLNVYKNKKNPCVEEFYVSDWRSKLLFKARTGSLEVNGRTYRWSDKSEFCECCTSREKETIEHMILSCEGHENERNVLFERMKGIIGEEKWNEVESRDDNGLTVILGFECDDDDLNSNRLNIANAMKDFLKNVWSKRD